jgi:hypothetical protein
VTGARNFTGAESYAGLGIVCASLSGRVRIIFLRDDFLVKYILGARQRADFLTGRRLLSQAGNPAKLRVRTKKATETPLTAIIERLKKHRLFVPFSTESVDKLLITRRYTQETGRKKPRVPNCLVKEQAYRSKINLFRFCPREPEITFHKSVAQRTRMLVADNTKTVPLISPLNRISFHAV